MADDMMRPSEYMGDEMRAANIALVRSAPELLAALDVAGEILCRLAAGESATVIAGNLRGPASAMNQIIAAIAKARGET